MSVIIQGHHRHHGTEILAIEGRAQVNNDARSRDAKAIYDFLRAHLPCGTLDLLSVRLCHFALDKLLNNDRIEGRDNTNDVRAAAKGWVEELDKEIQ